MMKIKKTHESKIQRELICASFLLGLVLIYQPVSLADQLALPTSDIVAPKVEHQPSNEAAVSGKAYSIIANVTDNNGVKSVLLFYRNIGSSEYNRLLMNSLGGDQYGITLDAEIVINPGLEYYIQAEDLAGNTLLHGYSFSPLIVKVIGSGLGEGLDGSDTTILAESDSPGQSGLSSGIFSNKWVWIGLGVLVAAASSGGGGGDDASAAPSGDGTATATIGGNAPPSAQ